MAESNINIELNDTNFVPLINQNEGASVETELFNNQIDNTLLFDHEIPDLAQNTEEVQKSATAETSLTKEISNSGSSSNEEHTVESPTTRQNYTFKCVFCDQILSAIDCPKLLECLHNSCINCLNNKLFENDGTSDKDQVICSVCSTPSLSLKIIENQFLLELNSNTEDQNTAKLANLKCSSCSDDAAATSYCTDCSEFICDNCVQAHQRLKITKDHTIKPKEDGLSELNAVSNGTSTNLFCSVHPNEKYSLFCETCDKLTCRDCQLIEHREHKYKFTNEIASDARKYITEMLKDVGYKRVLLSSAMKVIDDRQTLISEKKVALVQEITQLVMKLTNTIVMRGKQLVAKLSEVCDTKQSTLHEKKQALDQLSKMTDYCIEFTQYALENGSDMALLYSKKLVTDHLKRIKCRRADIPNPEIPVRIHLALEKVPELMKVMSTIGQIVVDGRTCMPNQQQQQQQSNSPSSACNQMPPPNSPSPIHRQPSPIMQQQQSAPPSTVFSRPPLPPSYNQHYSQNMPNINQQTGHRPQQQQGMGMAPNMVQNMAQSMNQSLAQNLGGNRMQNMFNRAPNVTIPQNQLNNRFAFQRSLLPRGPQNSMNLNQPPQQVSSSTHPQSLLQNRSHLRHLLQPSQQQQQQQQQQNTQNGTVYVQTGPSQYQAIQPHLAPQFQNRFPNQQQQQQQMQYRGPQPMPGGQNCGQMQPPVGPYGMPAAARWHIPQQLQTSISGGQSRNLSMPSMGENFKITLRQPQQQQQVQSNCGTGVTVTSTIPKTPSPNHMQNRCSDTERNLDKFCEDSVKDLMATIAKLDSNGVQVLAEGRQKGGSPHVDSSTNDAILTKVKSELNESGKDDPNEDWCAVCMDGGELVCCDKCPKVFHQYCHIPNLSVEENDTWQCLLCTNFADIPENPSNDRIDGELNLRERKVAERIVLELYCQYDPSLPFREIIGPEIEEYHQIIKNPIALDTIRQKLNWNAENRYRHMAELISDVRLMFRNAFTYNSIDSPIYNDAKTLEKFFDQLLEKFLPEYAYESYDDEVHPPNRKYRRILSD